MAAPIVNINGDRITRSTIEAYGPKTLADGTLALYVHTESRNYEWPVSTEAKLNAAMAVLDNLTEIDIIDDF